MELVQPLLSWRLTRHVNVVRERVMAVLARTSWTGSPQTLRPSQMVSPMSNDWMRAFESRPGADGDSG
jgi:hypothetical protein